MAQQWDQQTYYEILEVSPQAAESEIRQAYHRAKATYSQDNPALFSIFTKDETRQLMSLIEEAYSVLSQQSTRRAYDQSLRKTDAATHLSEQFIRDSITNSDNKGREELPQFDYDEARFKAAAKDPTTIATPEAVVPEAKATMPRGPSSIPEGHAKTFQGVYKLDPKLEEDIKQTQNCDGMFLEKVRKYKKVDLDRLSEHTRISRTYLTAVEKNDYENLPAPVFVRGFIVQVSRALGLDENKTSKGYMELYKKTKKP